MEISNYTQSSRITLYPQRWSILVSYCVFSFTNPMAFVQYAAVLDNACTYYDVSQNGIIWLSNMYYITYILFAGFAINVFEWRLDYGIFVGNILNVLAGWVKFFSGQNYYGALASYIIIGISQLFNSSVPVYIADRWFGADERTLATSIGVFINMLGINFGFILPIFMLNNVLMLYSSNRKAGTTQQIVQAISNLNLIFAFMQTFAMVLCFIFVRDRPPTPASYTSVEYKVGILDSYKGIFKSFKNVSELLCLSMALGVIWTFTSVISVLLLPFNYTQLQIGLIGLWANLTGTIGGTLASIFIDHQISKGSQPNYDFWIRLFLCIGFVSMLILSVVIQYNNIILCSILSALIGLGLNAYFPIACQSFIEKLYPNFELALVTSLQQAANLLGFLGNYLTLIPSLSGEGLWVLTGLLGPVVLYIIFIYKTKLNRLDMEEMMKLAKISK